MKLVCEIQKTQMSRFQMSPSAHNCSEGVTDPAGGAGESIEDHEAIISRFMTRRALSGNQQR